MTAALSGCAADQAVHQAPPGERSSPLAALRADGRLALAPRPEPSDRSLVPLTCYEGFVPSPDPAADLERLTSACGSQAGLTAVTPVRVGAPQDEQSGEERFSFHGRAGRCYRIFSVGAPGIADLDVAITDESGKLAAADASGDRFPIVPPRGALCLRADTLFTIHVGVLQGSGSYLLQVWGSPRTGPEEE